MDDAFQTTTRRAVLELDGERYEEHLAYDPLMVTRMWGYNLASRDEIMRISGADQDVVALCKRAYFTPRQRVLVGGARQGSYVLALVSQSIDAIGIEENSEMVQYITSIVPDIALTAGNLTKVPFPDGYVDGGFFHSSLFMQENPDLNRIELREIKRITKREGIVCMEGANGEYWEPLYKRRGELGEYSSAEEGLWAMKKDTSLAKWRKRADFVWLEFFFITVNTFGLRVNHVYHFIPKQAGVPQARYYHEVVNYEPVSYRLKLLNASGFVNLSGQPIVPGDIYSDYSLSAPFHSTTSPGMVIVARVC